MKKQSPLFIVFLTVFLDLLGFGILIPLLPFVASDYHAGGFQVGLLMSSYSIMQFLFAPLWGRVSDRYGRRPVILCSLIASTSGSLIFAFAKSLEWLFLSRIIAGIAAANISTAQAIVADCLPPQERTRGMGMVGAAIGLGFMFGPAIAGIMVQQHSYMLPFLVSAGLSGLDFVLAYILLPETLSLEGNSHLEQRRVSLKILRKALSVRRIPQLLSISLLYFIAFAMMEGTFGLFVEKEFALNARQNSYILFLVGVVMVIIQGGVVGRVAKRIGDLRVLEIGIFGVLLGLSLIGFSSTIHFLLGSVVVLAVFAGFSTPSLSSLISQISAQEVQGGILGLNQSMASLGRIAGPLCGGELFDAWGSRSPYFLSATLVLAALLLVLSFRFMKIKEPAPSGSS